MIVRVSATALLLLTTASTVALAQNSGGLSYSGAVRLGIVVDDQTSDEFRYGALDLDAEFAFGNGFGVGLDTFGLVNFDNTDNPFEYFNVFGFYETEFWRLSFGHTESASDLLLPDDRLGFGYPFNFEIGIGIESVIDGLYVFNETIYGITYVADFDGFEFAASVHAPDDFDNAIVALATRVPIADVFYFSSGIETLTNMPSGAVATGRLGAGYADNGIAVDALYTSAPQFLPDVSMISLDARYDVAQVQGLSLGASFLTFSTPSNDSQFYGVGAAFTHASGLGVQGNAVFDEDGDAQYGAEINFRF